MAAPSCVYDLLSSEAKARWNAGSAVGTPVTISYGFAASLPDSVSYSGFTPFTAAEIAAARKALAYISSFTRLAFVEEESGGQMQFGNANLGPGTGGKAGYSYGSDGITQATVFLSNAGSPSVADSRFTPGDIGSADLGGNSWETLLHEIGHALGLKHPFQTNIEGDPGSVLPAKLDDASRTVMSYTPVPHANIALVTGTETSYSYRTGGLSPQTYGLYDVAALQYLYGKAAGAAKKVLSFAPDQPVVMTVEAAGPGSTVDCSKLLGGSAIDLTPGAASRLAIAQKLPFGIALDNAYDGSAALTIAYGVLVANAIGGRGSDRITGNAVANRLTGGDGNDRLAGGAGKDTLSGGRGADTFVFDAKLGADNLDAITGFAPADDTIALAKGVFAALPAKGKLAEALFKDLGLKNARTDGDDRVLYSSKSGDLSYDADGSGKGKPVAFAHLDAGADGKFALLTAADFLVV